MQNGASDGTAQLDAATPTRDEGVPDLDTSLDWARPSEPTCVPGPPECPSCHAARMPKAKFCHQCGNRLATFGALDPAINAVPRFRAERRLLTILFCDLVNSVSLAAERDPEDVADVLREFHAALSATMSRFGGHFERPMGDGALFYFGYPAAAEDDCERAVEAALETIAAIARLPLQLGVQLQVRIGISAGVVVIGDLLGAADHGGHDVIGDVANLAARLQQTAAPGCVLVSDAVWERTRAAFDYQDIGPSHLRGWTDAMRLWRPLRCLPRADRFLARLTAGTSPIVGRQPELAALAEAWNQARNGAGQTVLLIGEPGIGKSRLAHELTAALLPAGTVVKRYLCAPMQQDAALHPIIEQFAYEAGLAPGDAPATRAARIRAALADCPEPDAALIAGLVAPDLATARPKTREASPKRQHDRILDALLARLLRVAAADPLVVVVEDAHWSDPTTLMLLARIAAAASARTLLLVVAARPQFRPGWAADPGVRRIQLDPLPPGDSERLVRAASGPLWLNDDVVADIVARSDGVPLFIEEVTRAMLEPGGGDSDVPASLHASLLSRIDRLGRARSVAEAAATIGRAFDLALLNAVCDAPPAELSHDLEQLMASGLVRPEASGGQTVYVFRHALIRDTTYGTIMRRRRRALHLRIAETLEREFAADAAAQPQQLALHYAAGGRDQQAASWWLRAGLQSLQRSAMTEAVIQLRRALALLEPLPDNTERRQVMLDILVVYGKVLIVTQGHAAAATRDTFARAYALCEQLEDPPQLLTVLFTQWTQSFFGGRMVAAEAQASELLRRATQRHDDIWLVMGRYSLGLTRLVTGDVQGSQNLLEQAAARFDTTRRDAYARPAIGDPLVIMRSFLGWGAMMRGAFSEARHQLDAAVTEAHGLQQPFSTALALYTRFYSVLGLHGAEAAAVLIPEYDLAAAGIEHFEAFGQIMQGWLLAASGDFEAGLLWSRRGRSRHAAAGTQVNHANCLRMEAEMLLGLGRAQPALEALEAAKQVQMEMAEHWDDAEFHRVRAEVLLAQSQDDGAEMELLAAGRVARERGQHLFGLRAAATHAPLLIRRGRAAEAVTRLREAVALVEHAPAVLDVAAADRLLEQLAVDA